MVGLSLSINLNIKPTLSQDQKLLLKEALKLVQKLKHPEYENTIKGFEGMMIADKMLKSKDSSGVLIGGLAQSLWNQQRQIGDLYKHKDVDVLVLNNNHGLENKFEGGIDWWLPQKDILTIKREFGNIYNYQTNWWENGNGIVLSFDIIKNYDLEPGLYIPGQELIIDMRLTEALANVNPKFMVENTYEVEEKMKKKIGQNIKTRLPKFIREKFKHQIMSSDYEQNHRIYDAIEFVSFGEGVLRAINIR